jgi:hypothetical protein
MSRMILCARSMVEAEALLCEPLSNGRWESSSMVPDEFAEEIISGMKNAIFWGQWVTIRRDREGSDAASRAR